MKKCVMFSVITILSLFMALLIVDFCNINFAYQQIIDINQTIKYKISKTGLIDKDFKNQYLEIYNIEIISSKKRYEVGEICKYSLVKNLNLIYKKILTSTIELKSETVVGIFNY